MAQENLHVEGFQTRKYILKYRSENKDLDWETNGLVASVVDGEIIPLIQQCISNADFYDLDIIHIGADKVFLRCLGGGGVQM